MLTEEEEDMARLVDKRSWHLDKRLNVSHLVTTLVLAVGVFTWASGIEQRINVNTIDVEHNKELMQLSQGYVTATVNTIEKKVDKIDIKLDKVLDRINTHDIKRGK